MNIMPIIRATAFGICFYAGLYHLLVGMRRKPIDRIHLTFAFTALAFAFRNFGEIFFNSAASDGRLNDYLYWGHLAVIGYIVGLIFLTWFVTFYTKGKPILIPLAITSAWLVLLWVHQTSPYFYLFTEEPVFVDATLPWGEVVTYGDAKMSIWADLEWIIVLTMVAFFIYASIRQYFRGERREALMLGFAVSIYMASFIHDILLDYDMINSFYILAQGFVVMIIMMSLTLSNEIIYTENALEELNVELEQRIDERTKDLSVAKQRAEAANESKSVFLANMSHELRTPLNAILGHAQIMSRDRSLKPDMRHSIEAVNRSGDHLMILINNVLEMSKIEAGKTVLSPASFDIDAILNDIELMFHERIIKKEIEFEIIKAPETPRLITADQGKIRQILINLSSNAINYTREGGITLSVSVDGENSDRPHLVFEVKDTGEGIEAENLALIFEPFKQSGGAPSQRSSTGLGLAISRQYAQMMDGDLTVESHLGQGSIFRLKIPVIEAKSTAHETGLVPSRQIVGILGEEREFRILVVDDNLSNRDVLIRMLSSEGFNIREAADGQEAIALFESWSPSLILMDIRMPVMDGIEAIKTIKSTEQGRVTPIIGVSASVFEEDQEKVLEIGADVFLPKPIQEAELLEKIGQCLNVEFLFDDQKRPATDRSQSLPLTGERLAELPKDLVEEMRAAVQGGYMDRLAELAKQVDVIGPELSEQFLKLIYDYDYETLYRLFLEEGEGKQGSSP